MSERRGRSQVSGTPEEAHLKTLAALATIPGRPLERVLRSLRPQVDVLCVWYNGVDSIARTGWDAVDRYFLSPRNTGNDLPKFSWANEWDGLYLACDDDLEYPPDYVATMRREVERWDGEAIVCVGGKRYDGKPASWRDWTAAYKWDDDCPHGAWVNAPVTAFLAWDARKLKPTQLSGHDGDAAIATWAQANRVPMWVIPHNRGWITYLLPKDADTLWAKAKREHFATRDAWIAAQPEWQTFKPSHEALVGEASQAVMRDHHETLRRLADA